MGILSFKDFRNQKAVTFIDIDETLFQTFAKIKVVRGNKVVRTLDNQEFNTDQLQPGEEYDFGEFRNAKLFAATSKPIKSTIVALQKIWRRALMTDGDVYLLTARADFDDKEGFIATLRKHGIPAGHSNNNMIHVIRAGNMGGSGSAQKKKEIIKDLIKNKDYTLVTILDDAKSNLDAFMEIPRELESNQRIIFQAIMLDHGRMVNYGRMYSGEKSAN